MVLFEITQLIMAVSSLVTPTIALLGYFSLHSKANQIQADVDVVRHETNSMKDELVNEVRIASLAKGRLDKEKELASNA